jgi:hypothetical protein
MKYKYTITRKGRKISEITSTSAINAAREFGGKLIISAPYCGVIEKDRTLFDISW